MALAPDLGMAMSTRLASLCIAALVAVGALAVVPAAAPASPPDQVTSLRLPPGASGLVAAGLPAAEPVLAVTMLDEPPTGADVRALRRLGLVAQPLTHLPMVLTKGTPAQLVSAVTDGIARDVYLDRPLEWHSRQSTAAIAADQTRALGYTGEDVGIAIVDSGIDATHPDLADNVVRNVRMYSPEYASILGLEDPTGVQWPSSPALVLPFDVLPYNNTDTIGHGTHVAGIAAGTGTGNPELVGVAPDASLIGYSTGEILFIFTALASFDDILATHEEFDIRVVNNSWGDSHQLFDPSAPINVATRALYDAGITVVFSAGNRSVEMSTNPYSMAPWVISSGSATLSKEKSGFSSSGMMFDNSRGAELDEDGHVRYEGDGLGITHPDVSAPGSDIESAGTPTGWTALAPPGGSAVASGTSMSAPHITGLAAVLLGANPGLTPDQVREVMQVTADPMRDEAAFWESGYGYVNALAAIELVTDGAFSAEILTRLQQARDAEILAARPYRVAAQDQWRFFQLPATVEGLDTRTFTFEVLPETEAIRAGIAFPADLGVAGLNLLFEWQVVLKDPAGAVVASSEPIPSAGVGIVQVDFEDLDTPPVPGTWTVEAIGWTHAAQPALLWGHRITVAVTQLIEQIPAVGEAIRVFEPTGSMALRFTGGDGGPLTSPEGCAYSLTPPNASMEEGPAETDCHAGTMGYLVNYGVGTDGRFLSGPLVDDVVLGGEASLTLYLADDLRPAWSTAFEGNLAVALDAIDESGELITAIASGEFPTGSPAAEDTGAAAEDDPSRRVFTLEVPTTELPAGAQLQVSMRLAGVYTSTTRLLWGGAYGDAGLDLITGILTEVRTQEPDAEPDPAPAPPAAPLPTTGAPAWTVLGLGLAVIGGLRRRQRV